MLIADWSSDVCSSDLIDRNVERHPEIIVEEIEPEIIEHQVDGILAFGEARLDDFLGLGRCAREGTFDRRDRQAMLGLEMMKECALADACLLADRARPQPRKAAPSDPFERFMRTALAPPHRSFALPTARSFLAPVLHGIPP